MQNLTYNPKVSVVIPLYNKEETIDRCVNSVLSQSFQDFEIIIVNDGSTDLSLERVKNFSDSRIRIFSQLNSGVSSARNFGICKSSTELIAFLDADDVWLPHFLESVMSLFIDNPKANWAATGFYLHPFGGNPHQNIINSLPNSFKRGLIHSYFKICAVSDPLVHSSSVCIRKKILEEIGGFPIGVYSGEDLLTWAKIASRYTLAYDKKPAAIFEASGIHRDPDHKCRVADGLINILKTEPHTNGLEEYIGLWFRMQAIAALRINDYDFARKMSLFSLRYNFFNLKNLYVALVVSLPKWMSHNLDFSLRKLRSFLNPR